MKKEKGNILIAVLAGLISAGIIIGSWLFIFQSLLFTPHGESLLGNNSVEEITKSWLVYEDKERGFNLRYPQNWEFNKDDREVFFTRQLSQIQALREDVPKKDFEIRLKIHPNEKSLELASWLKNYLRDKRAKKKDEMIINKKEAQKFYGLDGAEGNIDVFLAGKEATFQFTLVSLDGKDYTDKSKNPYPQNLFFQMLQTIRLEEG